MEQQNNTPNMPGTPNPNDANDADPPKPAVDPDPEEPDPEDPDFDDDRPRARIIPGGDGEYDTFIPIPGTPYGPDDPRYYALYPEDILPEEPEPPNWFDDDEDDEEEEEETEKYKAFQHASHASSQPLPAPGPETAAGEEKQDDDDGEEGEEIYYAHMSANGFKTPFYQWAVNLAQTDRPDECFDLTEQGYREVQVQKGQPFRKAILDEQEMGLPVPRTNGPLMLPDSYDPIANPDPDPDPPPGIPLRYYEPGTPAHEVLGGMAEDMVHVGSVMVARMRVALGYESDAKMIRLYKELALSLYKMHHITRAQKPKRPRGRPRKNAK